MPVDLCYVISHGFAARMIMQSSILSYLRQQGHSVALIVPNADEPQMQSTANRHGVELIQAPDLSSRLLHEYEWLIRRYLFEDVRANPALRAWHLQLKEMPDHPLRNKVRAGFYMGLNRLALRSPGFQKMLDRFETRFFLQNQQVSEILAQLQPRVLISTYPVLILEACFLYAARRAGITTVSQLLSWDNITSKGRFSISADYYLSWGPIMTEEIQSYYQVEQQRIYECGVAHFDRHISDRDPEQTRMLVQALGLDPDHPYLFFGMSSPTVSPREIEVVEWVAKSVDADVFGPEVQMIVRPHPQNVQGYTADASWLPRLKALASARVAVDYPRLEQSSLAWNMKEKDLPRLVNLLAGCTVSLNSGSTLSIDALVQNKPVILTTFDAEHELPWHRSIRRYLDYYHTAKLIALGGVRTTHSFADLQEVISRYLADPDHDAEARAYALEQECGRCDGQASRRVAEALTSILGHLSSENPRQVTSAHV